MSSSLQSLRTTVAGSSAIGYVLKMYPRFSETFIVNEILALEKEGLCLDIFSLRSPNDSHFHETLAEVKAGVTYIKNNPVKSVDLWNVWHEAASVLPHFWSTIAESREHDVFDVHQAVDLALKVRERRLTHLHAHFASTATNVAQLAAQMAGISFSFTAHAKDIFHDDVDLEHLQNQIKKASYVITISDYNYRYLCDLCPGAVHKIYKIYNGLDLKKYPFSTPSLSLPSIIAVGRLVEKKGFNVLIEACRILRDEGLMVPCSIVGSGNCFHSLSKQIVDFNLQQQVHLVGPMPHGKIIQAVSSSTLFAAPCVVGNDGNRDGLPTVLLEAMALGTPCISTDVTGIPELLQHELTGLTVPQHDPVALAKSIKQLLHDPDLCSRLAKNARARIETDFEISNNCQRIYSLHSSNSSSASNIH